MFVLHLKQDRLELPGAADGHSQKKRSKLTNGNPANPARRFNHGIEKAPMAIGR